MKNTWDPKEFGFQTRAIHAGQEPDPATGAIMTPLYLTSTFVQSSPGVHKGYDYSRAGNPTRSAYEACVANLESGKHGFAFASGCAASTTALHLLKAGDHVIASDDMYGGSFRLMDKVVRHNGIDFSFVDLTKVENFKAAIKPNTKMVWIETPTNPTMKLVDIRRTAEAAKAKGILSIVDNTFMSPYFQRPLELGADIVLHSTTKYIGGHSDMIGGALVVNDDQIAEKLAFLLKSIGAIASPFDAFMAMRSLKTLPLRMRQHDANGREIAKFLEKHPKIDRIAYPGLASHPQHELAKEQMHGFGGMMTFHLKGGLAESRRVLESVKVFALAESLGGVESLIEHPAIMTHASVPAEQRKALGIGDGMIRLSVGVENLEDLMRDLSDALSKA
ncbi:MAG TPA: cystathionine gamma-synthase [Bdellovibrionales bacterium]|nr:cystathionine gamma-synthase [Bdellovibrionales bacterium]